MAFTFEGIGTIGGQSRSGNSFQVFNYKSSDNFETIKSAGYFNEMFGKLRVNDIIWINNGLDFFLRVTETPLNADIKVVEVIAQFTTDDDGNVRLLDENSKLVFENTNGKLEIDSKLVFENEDDNLEIDSTGVYDNGSPLLSSDEKIYTEEIKQAFRDNIEVYSTEEVDDMDELNAKKETDFINPITSTNKGLTNLNANTAIDANNKVATMVEINAISNGNYLGKSYWFGKTTLDFIISNPTNESQNYIDFTDNKVYEAKEDLTGWNFVETIIPVDTEQVLITSKFWDISEADYPGTAIYSTITDWSYFPRLAGQGDGITINERQPDGTLQVIDEAITFPKLSLDVKNEIKVPLVTELSLTGNFTILSGVIYQIVAAGDIVFDPSVPTDLTIHNQIKMFLKTGATAPTIDWGTVGLLNGKEITIKEDSNYVIYYDYDPNRSMWVVGGMEQA